MAITSIRQQVGDVLEPWLERRGVMVPDGALGALYRCYKFVDLWPLRRLIRRRVEIGSLAIDVGAHLGFATRPLALAVGPKGRVIALEPQVELGTWITETGENVRFVNAAAHDKDGCGSLARGGTFGTDSHVAEHPGPIRLVAIDSMSTEFEGLRVSFIKVDAQGSEYHVLAGARTILRDHRPDIFIELGERGLMRAGRTVDDVMDLLVKANYRPHKVSMFGARLVGIESVKIAVRRRGYADYLFVHASRLSERRS